ncbi:MAG: hypothetical protein R3342_13290 [Lutibacter sp.]|uniref:hypothetical protein n=1 Tax=Lutibacter sp. TaxID=1925666 RepID=UPI00299EA4D9|nr:hypothetical protein [Lutibacter sp.]MDX1830508.1 hypothetical protein [Lutibacter sp.]
MRKIKSLLTLGIIGTFLICCDQLNSAYLYNDTPDTVDVVLSIINPKEVESSFIFRKLSGDSTANIYKLNNQTTRIEFSVCSKCEFEMFFDTARLRAQNLGVDSLKIIKKNGILQYTTKEDIFNAFVEREHYSEKYLTIIN